jgi:hypothetical protein
MALFKLGHQAKSMGRLQLRAVYGTGWNLAGCFGVAFEAEGRMAKKRTSKPMETQPVSTARNIATPIGSRPSKRAKAILAPSIPPAKAERSRRSSLKKQRDQIEAMGKRRKPGRVGDR